MTAVPATVFRSGQPVAQRMVRVTPQQMARGQIVPHPSVNPNASALLAGRQVKAPPIRTARVTAPPAAGRAAVSRPPTPPNSRPPAEPQTARVAQPQSSRPPLITRSTPPQTRATPQRSPTPAPGSTRPQFITRTPLPPRAVPFSTRQQAMQVDPGRPLEPQQRANLRAGKPAGPQRDREFPPHPQQTQRGTKSERPAEQRK